MTTTVRITKNFPSLVNLLNILSNGKNYTSTALSDRMNISDSTIRGQLQQLREFGYVAKTNNGYMITTLGAEINHNISENFANL
jgi:predicted transcriptional regulator